MVAHNILIRVVDFTEDGLDVESVKFIQPETHEKIKPYTISSEDVYVSIAGTIGKVGIIPEYFNGANLTENAAKITEIHPSVDPTFLLSFLRSHKGQQILKYSAGGTSQPKLALYKILAISFQLPDLQTQKRISVILSGYDKLINNNRRQIALLDKAARLIYREWFVHFRFPNHESSNFKNGLPVGWRETPWGNSVHKQAATEEKSYLT